ncbi:MAG: hypothetical protein WA708_06440 [Acidobacteriaceae bacterium]
MNNRQHRGESPSDECSSSPREPKSANRHRLYESERAKIASKLAFGLMLSVPTAFVVGLPASSRAQSATQPPGAPVSPPISQVLQPALEQAGSSLRQIQIDRWKLSRQWKAQIQSDASSIQQDLSMQLPALFQQAQASPALIGPQLSLLRNVDALYDVMVRVTTAANLSGGKSDAALLDSALQRLEQARKSAADSLLQSAALQDRQVMQLRAVVQAAARVEHESSEHPKTIVVDNGVTHRTRRRKKISHPKPSSKPNPSAPAASTGSKTNPEK